MQQDAEAIKQVSGTASVSVHHEHSFVLKAFGGGGIGHVSFTREQENHSTSFNESDCCIDYTRVKISGCDVIFFLNTPSHLCVVDGLFSCIHAHPCMFYVMYPG